jgi:hypothetical protein
MFDLNQEDDKQPDGAKAEAQQKPDADAKSRPK